MSKEKQKEKEKLFFFCCQKLLASHGWTGHFSAAVWEENFPPVWTEHADFHRSSPGSRDNTFLFTIYLSRMEELGETLLSKWPVQLKAEPLRGQGPDEGKWFQGVARLHFYSKPSEVSGYLHELLVNGKSLLQEQILTF